MAKGSGFVIGNNPRKANAVGKLRHRVTIEKPTYADDGQGGSATTWTTFAGPIWGTVEPKASKERFFAEQIQNQVTHKVQIRYLAGVTQEMRVNFQGRFLSIKGVYAVDERHFWMVLECIEGQAT